MLKTSFENLKSLALMCKQDKKKILCKTINSCEVNIMCKAKQILTFTNCRIDSI